MLACLCMCVSHSAMSDSFVSLSSWTVDRQAPLYMGFLRQEYWSGLPYPCPGYLPDPGMKPGFPVLHAVSLPAEPPGKPVGLFRMK